MKDGPPTAMIGGPLVRAACVFADGANRRWGAGRAGQPLANRNLSRGCNATRTSYLPRDLLAPIAPQPNVSFVSVPVTKNQMLATFFCAFQQVLFVDLCTT